MPVVISLALSKGRILEETLPLLEAAGVVPSEHPDDSRKLIIPTSRPDVRLIIVRATDVPTLAVTQARLLENAARLLKPGGRLVYATCSLLEEENQRIVEEFLATHAGFRLKPVREVLEEQHVELSMGDYLELFPHRHGTDGFFAAVMERAG